VPLHEWKRFAQRSRTRGLAATWQAFTLRLAMLRHATPHKITNFLLVKIQKRLRFDRVHGFPYRYKIDPTNICTLHCPLCPTGRGLTTRASGSIDESTYRDIIDQMAPHALVLDLFGWGEPLNHPGLNQMIGYADKQGLFTRLSTTLEKPGWSGAEGLVASGLDAIIVAADGASQETYGHYRRGGNWDNVLANVRSLVAARLDAGRTTPHITMRMLIHRHNEDQIAEVRRLTHELGADAFTTGNIVVNTKDRGQIADWLPTDPDVNGYNQGLINRGSCEDLWESLVINWDGGVAPCCWIYGAEHDLGNVATTSLDRLWNGPAFVAARRAVSRKPSLEGEPVVLCSSCAGHPDYLSDSKG